MKKNWIVVVGMIFCTIFSMQARSSGNVCTIHVTQKKFYNNNNRAQQNNHNRRTHQPRKYNHIPRGNKPSGKVRYQ
jgi:hypothetical protein